MKNLPISISNLPEMINGNFIYVDKTPYIKKLIDKNKYCFLSRPRRFGKSLLVNTLYHLFIADEKLFRDLYIHPHWDWSIKYPVLRFDLSQERHKTPESLNKYLLRQLKNNQHDLNLECSEKNNISSCFQELIRKAHKKYQQPVVILVDEYDAPLLDHITDSEGAKTIRKELDSFYSVIKGEDQYLRFVLLTGVSKFAKVSIFSKLNNLIDIGMKSPFSALCGYTQKELEHYFVDYLHGIDKQELKEWYNGYHWLGESVYNPFNILLFFDNENSYLPYWFETGASHFLIELLEESHYHLPNLENTRVGYTDLNDFDIGRIRFEVLLFQAGYLTIDKINMGRWIQYRFSYPNLEVRQALNHYFLQHYLIKKPQSLESIHHAFLTHDFNLLKQCFCLLFNKIPYNNYSKNSIAEYEGYYASVMYAFLYSLYFTIIPEDTSNKGRIDITVKFNLASGKQCIYIFEFKVIKSEKADGSALQQIKRNNYAAQYQQENTKIVLIGIEFSSKTRNIVGFAWEEMD